ncbi:hypothetical protein OHA53_11055 [Streptomyces althioticus]|uniref:hypothetical protein n=1 Tax=Streptomyces althioticus TaxID=83380 RepID=UPI003873BAC8|nr:hypothetical protein OHA53_11055 [Streptomyces althioticus]
MTEIPTDFPPPGVTQMEWHEMSTSERAAVTYAGEPSSFEDDYDVDLFRWATRWAGR